MKNFFLKDAIPNIPLFGLIHISIIILTFLIIYLIYKYRKKLRNWKYKELFKYILVFILFTNMMIFYIGKWYAGVYNIQEHLPLHYCFITGYILMYIIIFNKQKIFNFLYYGIVICTLSVIIWQEPLSYYQYEVYQLILSHHLLLITAMYTLIVLQYKVDFSGYLKAFIYSVSVFIITMIINNIIGSNYMFSDGFPDFIKELYPFVVTYNYPFLYMLAIGTIFGVIAYIPVHIINKEKENIN